MGKNLYKFLFKYICLIPNKMSNFFLSKTNTFIKSITLFDTIEYKSEYKGDHLFFFSLPLLMNISQIFNDIKKITFNKKVISIISVLIFHEKDSDNKYIHSLSESNKLYSLEDFDKWPDIVLSNIIEKLELYNSFKKISFNVKVKIITNV